MYDFVPTPAYTQPSTVYMQPVYLHMKYHLSYVFAILLMCDTLNSVTTRILMQIPIGCEFGRELGRDFRFTVIILSIADPFRILDRTVQSFRL